MACHCTCGDIIDCDETKCFRCQAKEEAEKGTTGFHVLGPDDLPRSGLGLEDKDPVNDPT